MNKRLKKLIAVVLVMVMSLSLATTAFAIVKEDTETTTHSEFGTLTGWQGNYGKEPETGKKEVIFSVEITKLSSTTINTTLNAMVEIYDYKTGKYLDHDRIGGTNVYEASYYWQSHSSASNDNLVSSFGAHEARRAGSAVVYTSIYGF